MAVLYTCRSPPHGEDGSKPCEAPPAMLVFATLTAVAFATRTCCKPKRHDFEALRSYWGREANERRGPLLLVHIPGAAR